MLEINIYRLEEIYVQQYMRAWVHYDPTKIQAGARQAYILIPAVRRHRRLHTRLKQNQFREKRDTKWTALLTLRALVRYC
jgi:hypothetical protein